MSKGKKPNISKTHIHQAISGIPYPATKEELIEYARTKTENGGVVDLLEELPGMDYANEPQVLSTLREYTDF